MKAEKSRKLPFPCSVGTDSEVVTNPLSGEKCTLPPDAVAVYDVTMGASFLGKFDIMIKGIDWFIKYFPKEYMILLD